MLVTNEVTLVSPEGDALGNQWKKKNGDQKVCGVTGMWTTEMEDKLTELWQENKDLYYNKSNTSHFGLFNKNVMAYKQCKLLASVHVC